MTCKFKIKASEIVNGLQVLGYGYLAFLGEHYQEQALQKLSNYNILQGQLSDFAAGGIATSITSFLSRISINYDEKLGKYIIMGGQVAYPALFSFLEMNSPNSDINDVFAVWLGFGTAKLFPYVANSLSDYLYKDNAPLYERNR